MFKPLRKNFKRGVLTERDCEFLEKYKLLSYLKKVNNKIKTKDNNSFLWGTEKSIIQGVINSEE